MKRIALLAFAVLLLCGSTSWGQDRCVPFTGTITAGLVLDLQLQPPQPRWIGVASFNIESTPANTVTKPLGLKRGTSGDPETLPWIGTEETRVEFSPGVGFTLLTSFVAPASHDGKVNEKGTIAPLTGATGKYENVYGHFTLHGPAGPVTAGSPLLPPGYPWDPSLYFPLWFGWTGEYHGNICGID